MKAMNTQYKILKDSNGNRVIRLANGGLIPADIAGMATGKDEWLSQIVCKCRDCKQEFPLSQLHGGGQWCESCQELALVE